MCQPGSNKTGFTAERTEHISHITVRAPQSAITSPLDSSDCRRPHGKKKKKGYMQHLRDLWDLWNAIDQRLEFDLFRAAVRGKKGFY